MDTKLNFKVLDKGFVNTLEVYGKDLTVVNRARVSFNKQVNEFTTKDEQLVNYLAEHKHQCYDKITEVFTNNGWKLFKDLNEDDLIAAVDPIKNTFKFEKPSHKYENIYNGKMLSIEQSHVSMLVTPNHNIWAALRHSSGFHSFKFIEADKTYNKQYRILTTALYEQGEKGNEKDYYNGFLYGFFLGDGFRSSTNQISFHIKKQRKLDALFLCANMLNLDIKELENNVFVIKNNLEYFNGKADNKSISEHTFNQTIEYMQGVFDGLMQSDGSKKRSSYQYTTISKQLKTDIIRLGTYLGYYIKENKMQECYRLMILSRSTSPRLNDDGTKHNKWIDYNDKIYCVTVSTGLILTRRNNCIAICGNSPFRHVFITYHIKMPIFVMRQFVKHRIGVEINEISGRYIEFQDGDFYVPSIFRKQSKNNKQGSEGILDDGDNVRALLDYEHTCKKSFETYKTLLNQGVSKEMARMCLPLSLYTEIHVTMSLEAIAHFVQLRKDGHAQYEIQKYADAMSMIASEYFPYTYGALLDNM
jgi:thymidylate synthase (FAD)